MLFVYVLIGIVTAALLAGGWLVRSGVVGVRIDDHPCCGGCGYDLSAIDVESACPECGAPSTVKRLIGNRARRPRRVAIGIGLLVAGVTLSGGVMYRLASGGSLRSVAPLWLVRAEASGGSLPAIRELSRRVWSGGLAAAQVDAVVDDALEQRHSSWVGLRAVWGGVIDAALARNSLDAERTRRCIGEAVGVHWSGSTERFSTGSGRASQSSILFVFAPAVGSASTLDYDADIEFASVDGEEIDVDYKETDVYYYHVPNSAPMDTYISVALPEATAGRRLTVRWRVAIKDAASGAVLAPDWVHTEEFVFPAASDGMYFGTRTRAQGE